VNTVHLPDSEAYRRLHFILHCGVIKRYHSFQYTELHIVSLKKMFIIEP